MSDQLALGLRDVAALGQIFTPEPVVRAMLALRRNTGRVLEPSCGDGAFLRHLPGAVGLELDPDHCPPGAQAIDFFAYPEREQFDAAQAVEAELAVQRAVEAGAPRRTRLQLVDDLVDQA